MWSASVFVDHTSDPKAIEIGPIIPTLVQNVLIAVLSTTQSKWWACLTPKTHVKDRTVTIMQHNDVAVDVQQGSQQNSWLSNYTAACKWLYSKSSSSRGVITPSGGDRVPLWPRVPGSSPSGRCFGSRERCQSTLEQGIKCSKTSLYHHYILVITP